MLDLVKVQKLYDSGLSIRKISSMLNIPHSQFSSKIKTRTKKEAGKIAVIKQTEEGLQKLSKFAKERNLGGYRPHPNRGKRYKGIWFDSNWEVIVAESLDANNIAWERPKQGFVWNDKGNKYYPDFYLPNYDVYLDPKNGYLRKQHAEKIFEAQRINKIKVIVLDYDQLSWDKIQMLL
jgi:hypothetical protein